MPDMFTSICTVLTLSLWAHTLIVSYAPADRWDMQTPHMDFMVSEGIQLTGFYSFKYCSPTRSAFLSGRNPIHVNVVNGQTTCHNPADNVSGFRYF